jgi:hypothetical protein
MEQQVRPIYNKIIQSVELFYEENKYLSRKESDTSTRKNQNQDQEN